jgi:hypothetical protein
MSDAGDYYSRSNVVHLDGTPIFQTKEDRQNQSDIAKLVEQAWKCSLRPFGALAAIDWYADRYGRLIGVLELKARSHASDQHATVFLNVRKWLALSLASVGLGIPAVYVVRFIDTTKWISIADIDARNHTIGGCARIVKSSTDIEPVILVPISAMRTLRP